MPLLSQVDIRDAEMQWVLIYSAGKLERFWASTDV
jgi:hypothetical protein